MNVTKFCPEDFVFGTPREIPDIDVGDGSDVLNGASKVLTESGTDVTESMIKASEKMLEVAIENNIELAILMDVSGACGSQVIYNGHRLHENASYKIGMGVCAAQLHRNGIKIISQRDYYSLEILLSKLDSHHQFNKDALDHDESQWYKDYFGK